MKRSVYQVWNKKREKRTKTKFVMLGEILKVGKNDVYKLKFTSPVSQVWKSEWFSVEDIADFKKKLKGNKHGLKKRKKQYQICLLIPLTKENRLAEFFEQGYGVSSDSPGDGNCQFHAMAHTLSRYGIYRSTQSLRANIARHLENKPNDRDGMSLELLMGMSFSDDVGQMASDGTYGDQLTLRAASDIYNIQFTIISTVGTQGRADISPDGFYSLAKIMLGHFAKGSGDLCVLSRESGTPSAEPRRT